MKADGESSGLFITTEKAESFQEGTYEKF